MPESIPQISVGWLLVVVIAAVAKDVLPWTYKRFWTKQKDAQDFDKGEAELEALERRNTSDHMDEMAKSVEVIEKVTAKFNEQVQIISDLKAEKIDDDRKIARRDGVIEYQREDIKTLHEDVAVLRERDRQCQDTMAAMKIEIGDLREQNKILNGQYLQIKGMLEKAESNAGTKEAGKVDH